MDPHNKSIFHYVVDKSRFVNSECNNYSPPFLTYIPYPVFNINVDIENDLKGMTKLNTKCSQHKYNPVNQNLIQNTNYHQFAKSNKKQ